LKAVVQKKENEDVEDNAVMMSSMEEEKQESGECVVINPMAASISDSAQVDEDQEEDIWIDENEAQRLISLVKGSVIVEPKERP
jgi:hypothetical protein